MTPYTDPRVDDPVRRLLDPATDEYQAARSAVAMVIVSNDDWPASAKSFPEIAAEVLAVLAALAQEAAK